MLYGFCLILCRSVVRVMQGLKDLFSLELRARRGRLRYQWPPWQEVHLLLTKPCSLKMHEMIFVLLSHF